MRKLGLETRKKEVADNQGTEGLNSFPTGQQEQTIYAVSWWSFINSQS